VIKTDVKLKHDLVNCPNNGIKIGADHVTLDLNGHSIEGNAKQVHSCHANTCDVGIVAAHKEDVRITGGKVKSFNLGVLSYRDRHAVLDHLSLAKNRYSGLVVVQSALVRVFRSRITRNGLHTDSGGVGVMQSRRVRIAHSASTQNGDIGIDVENTNASHFAKNDLSANPEAGINLSGNQNSIARNRIKRSGDGAIVSGNSNRVAANRIVSPTGCHPGCGVGISVEDGRRNLISANTVLDAHNVGIRVKTFVRGQRLRSTELKINHVARSMRHGILVGQDLRHVDLRANYVRRNGKDGIRVKSPGTRLAYNFANHNGDLGIDAIAGVLDAHHNTAHDNGDPRQCVGVVCSAS
jgi:parallel beta helix pectate lyase-like protein